MFYVRPQFLLHEPWQWLWHFRLRYPWRPKLPACSAKYFTELWWQWKLPPILPNKQVKRTSSYVKPSPRILFSCAVIAIKLGFEVRKRLLFNCVQIYNYLLKYTCHKFKSHSAINANMANLPVAPTPFYTEAGLPAPIASWVLFFFRQISMHPSIRGQGHFTLFYFLHQFFKLVVFPLGGILCLNRKRWNASSIFHMIGQPKWKWGHFSIPGIDGFWLLWQS